MEQCVHRQRFDSTQHEARVILDWISFYSDRRSHRALAMRTPAEAFRLAASPEQSPLKHYGLLVARYPVGQDRCYKFLAVQ